MLTTICPDTLRGLKKKKSRSAFQHGGGAVEKGPALSRSGTSRRCARATKCG